MIYKKKHIYGGFVLLSVFLALISSAGITTLLVDRENFKLIIIPLFFLFFYSLHLFQRNMKAVSLEDEYIEIFFYKKPSLKIYLNSIVSIKHHSPIPDFDEYYYIIKYNKNEEIEIESRIIHLDVFSSYCNRHSIKLEKIIAYI